MLNTSLPVANSFGYQLSIIRQSDDSIFIQVSLGDSVYKKYRTTYVLGVSRDSLCFAAVGKDMYRFSIPKSNFPEGKASLLLFNDKQEVVSQRDVYIQGPKSDLVIVPDRARYGPREKVKLSITSGQNGSNLAPNAIFSISVTDDRINDDIGSPDQIMKISNSSTYSSGQWDLVMLSRPLLYLGWPKNSHTNFMGQPKETSDSTVTRLTGQVLNRIRLPEKNKIVTLLSNNEEIILETDTTDESGRFQFRLPDNILDSTKLYFQISDLKGIAVPDSIVVDSSFFPRFNTPIALKKWFSISKESISEEFKIYQLDTISFGSGKEWLKPVLVTGRKKAQVTYDESKIVSPFSRIIPGDKIGLNPNSIEDALLSIAGVTYSHNGVTIRGGGIGGGEPLLFVDGFQVKLNLGPPGSTPLLDYLRSLNPRNIDFIEVLEGADATIYGPGSDGGVVYIHTLNGGRQDPEDLKKGMKIFYARGYYAAPEFQEPDYDKKEIRNSLYPDQRLTIYWNGNIVTDNRGKASLQFFTADSPTKYSVRLIGLTAGGEILYANAKIIVHQSN